MATETITNTMLNPVVCEVWSRRAADLGELPTKGDRDKWTVDDRLRCERVRLETGLAGGNAIISYVPSVVAEFSIEQMMRRYSVDDQVQIVVYPYDDEGVAGVSEAADAQGRVIFEGILTRHTFEAQGARGESLGFVAQPITTLDREHPDHLITGRWIDKDPPIETIDLPAVFNFRSRPNMSADTQISAKVHADRADESEHLTLDAHVFTHDDDPTAKPWTVRDALASIVVRWLYGATYSDESGNEQTDKQLPRHTDLSTATYDALNSTVAGLVNERYDGLTAILPETKVHGLDWEAAFAAVCAAGGFDYALIPIQDYEIVNADEDAPVRTGDRRFELEIWRKGTGELVDVYLQKRGSTNEDAETFNKANNVPSISGMADATGITNTVYATGRTLIECVLPLKPLWNPDDMDTTTVSSTLQKAKPAADDLNGEGYFARHVRGGVLFDQYGHVGRAWGIDCVGGFDGYTSGEYQHDADGFDFVTQLDLNNAKPITEQRSNGNVEDDIRWMKRVRHPLPLLSPAAKRADLKFVLEISEDSGSTWVVYPGRFVTLKDIFGVVLTVPNLAMCNTESLRRQAEAPAAASSYWGLLRAGTAMRARLHCVIPADHAVRHIAPQQQTAGSRYKRADWIHVPVDTLWVQPGTIKNNEDGAEWKSIAMYGSTEIDEQLTSAVRDAAERRRDVLEDRALSLNIATPQMLMNRYQLGQRVRGVRGRNITLAANVGNVRTYPNIVGITYDLGSAATQRIELTLEDQRMAMVR